MSLCQLSEEVILELGVDNSDNRVPLEELSVKDAEDTRANIDQDAEYWGKTVLTLPLVREAFWKCCIQKRCENMNVIFYSYSHARKRFGDKLNDFELLTVLVDFELMKKKLSSPHIDE